MKNFQINSVLQIRVIYRFYHKFKTSSVYLCYALKEVQTNKMQTYNSKVCLQQQNPKSTRVLPRGAHHWRTCMEVTKGTNHIQLFFQVLNYRSLKKENWDKPQVFNFTIRKIAADDMGDTASWKVILKSSTMFQHVASQILK